MFDPTAEEVMKLPFANNFLEGNTKIDPRGPSEPGSVSFAAVKVEGGSKKMNDRMKAQGTDISL